jgi:glutathione peroxidase
MAQTVHDFSATNIRGEEKPLAQYKGQVMLIVNTASRCGFTPQLEGLEALHKKYSDKGLAILGFPCNQFLYQDPGSNSDIATFCQRNYGVSFPMYAKVDVNGRNTHPLYKFLKSSARGMWGTQRIKWNFTKFLVDKNGKVIRRYAPKVTPEAIEKDIASIL